VKLFLLLLAWSAVVLLLMSIDSPLHDGYSHNDSAWFFMCGKAVMNGLTPYVDFTDSKGPLLWLVYGIAYLLSPTTYHGAYVLGSLCYAGTFYYNYKTARLLLGDDRRALVVTLLMPLAYFMHWFYYEFRAEDFCNLPVAASMYYLFALLYGQDAEKPSARRCGLVLGGCFMALVLIKYSIAVMQASMIAVALWYYLWVRQEYGFFKWLCGGMAAVALPFVVWLSATGAFGAFIDEYFVNTMRSVAPKDSLPVTLLSEFADSLGTPAEQAVLLFTALGGWLLSRRPAKYRYVPLAVALFFYLIATRHNLTYYYAACNIFVLYLFIYVAGLSKKPWGWRPVVTAIAVVLLWGVFENLRERSFIGRTAVWAQNKDRASYERLSSNIQGDKPRIMTLLAGEFGFGMAAEALPAGRYWCQMYGATPEMLKGHIALLKSGRADYVIAYNADNCRRKGFTTDRMRRYGYEPCDSLTYINYKYLPLTTIIYKRAPGK